MMKNIRLTRTFDMTPDRFKAHGQLMHNHLIHCTQPHPTNMNKLAFIISAKKHQFSFSVKKIDNYIYTPVLLKIVLSHHMLYCGMLFRFQILIIYHLAAIVSILLYNSSAITKSRYYTLTEVLNGTNSFISLLHRDSICTYDGQFTIVILASSCGEQSGYRKAFE